MADLWTRLAARALGSGETVAPRNLSRFEPTGEERDDDTPEPLFPEPPASFERPATVATELRHTSTSVELRGIVPRPPAAAVPPPPAPATATSAPAPSVVTPVPAPEPVTGVPTAPAVSPVVRERPAEPAPAPVPSVVPVPERWPYQERVFDHRRDGDGPPVIQIAIGRIEVRAAPPPAGRPAPAPAARPATGPKEPERLSLSAYLSGERGGP